MSPRYPQMPLSVYEVSVKPRRLKKPEQLASFGSFVVKFLTLKLLKSVSKILTRVRGVRK